MKKIMMFFLILIIFSIENVLAQNQYHLTLQKVDGVYILRRGVNYNDDSHEYYLYKFNDMFVYCLEPGKSIGTYDYVGVDTFVNLSLSEKVQEKIELIGYYGRDYPGHDNVRYSMAAQALIWELTGVDTVTFWTKVNGGGNQIDVTNERNEIMRLVNNHLKLPSIEDNIKANLQEEIVINDLNGVLNNYEIESNGGNEVVIENNTLKIVPKKVGNSTITLSHKKYDSHETIIFVSKNNSNSQIMGRLRLSVTEKKFNINLNTKGTKLKVNKIDDEGNLIKLENIKFKIKNLITNEYLGEFETNNEGYFITDYLDYGEYELEEVEQDIPNYLWNPNKIKIVFDNNTILKEDDNYNYIEIDFVNNIVKGSIEINKKGEDVIFDDEVIYKETDLSNIEFNIYNDQDELIDTIMTNNNGIAKSNDLLIGKYYIKEKTKLDNYVLNEDKVYFEIKKENNQGNKVNFEIKNYLKKGDLEFSKEDLVISEGIPNTIIELYDEKNNLLLTRETDENGKIFIKYLPIGKYYLLEKEANSNYLLTNEKVYFEIKENEVIKAKMTNEKKIIKVPKTFTNGNIVNSLFIISFLIEVIYYERKETI